MNKHEALTEILNMSKEFSDPGTSRYVGKDLRMSFLDISRRLAEIHNVLDTSTVVITTQKISDYDRAMGIV
jgi:hypothetical protein